MRVLHVVPYYPPRRPGGVGVYAARLHRALRDAGHDSRVWTRGLEEPGDADDAVERLALSPRGWLAALVLRARAAAEHDIVHVHAGEALPLVAVLRLAARRPRIVATWHVSYAGMARAADAYVLEGRRFAPRARVPLGPTLRTWAHRVADLLTRPLVDAAVPISDACARELLGPRCGARARVIHHGVPEAAGEGRAPDLPHAALLYVGVPGPRKRAHALPFLLARVRDACPGTRLRIVGFGAGDAPDLCAAFAGRGLAGAVDWAGAIPPEALPACYRAADLLVAPSAYEGVPLAVIEAMQCGLPVVATRIPGHAVAIEDGESGALVPVDDPPAMAARCIDLLRDASRRRRLGAAAAAAARERFGMERHVRAYLGLYAELCGAVA